MNYIFGKDINMSKTTARKRTTKPSEKRGTLVKLSSLAKTELTRVSFDDLWIMKPETALRARPTRSYCSCRSVCIV
jgi:hypothetical protein